MGRLRRKCFVLQEISFVRTLTVFALIGGLNTSAWADSFNEKLLDRIGDLEACFSAKLSHHRQHDQSIPLQESAFTKFYIFDRIIGYTANSTTELTDAQLEAFCEDQLWLPYLAGFTATIDKRKRENAGELAPLGTAPIETDSWFIQFTHNQLGVGAHNNGHSNLTALALNEFQWKNRFTPMANDLIVRSVISA